MNLRVSTEKKKLFFCSSLRNHFVGLGSILFRGILGPLLTMLHCSDSLLSDYNINTSMQDSRCASARLPPTHPIIPNRQLSH